MASAKQVKYAKDLLMRRGVLEVDEYQLGEEIPGPIISGFINSLKEGTVPSKEGWNLEVAKFFVSNSASGPEAFNIEMMYIRDLFLRDLVKKTLNRVPDYFYEIPASSTGKYHPDYALGKGGLLRHTKAAVKIALSLLENPSLSFDQVHKDMIIGSLILHDTCKHGLEKSDYSVIDHPLLVEKLIDPDWVSSPREELVKDGLVSCIRSHMGPWNKDRNGNPVLPVPETPTEKFCHMCDYLASRKFLEVSFKI